ncbi:MAG: 7-cyano-7-deazaguanine synthase QueC [Rickettsiaceae bacterium]|nr:7-cyano-7-deazaguanine synthase QueC [Rickettsiaceae bacterium]MDP4832868.1 7-cyano-7-deazaguanine synthase QueC [Rickettsiaceae bacterium]MDP5021076.1 7-cyano-7-deazaguanine synthase QueC [Rickettsiaceae bacterium]MDP5082796.1 7-cyano-7-deazaguanine synthase QueC [Rickettsiaceae bacterium]
MVNKKAVILVSGGVDSSTVLAMIKKEGFDIYALSFNYAQNHVIELNKIKQFIAKYNVKEHRIVDLDLSAFTSSALVSGGGDVPKYKTADDLGNNIPVTYVPARNTIFLSYALGYAEVVGANNIFIGAHSTDSANYPDCRSEYIKSYEKMANLATKAGVEGEKISIIAPLIKMSKSEIVAEGIKLGVNYSDTISCYDPTSDGNSCAKCHACLTRLKAFKDNHLEDPIAYVR